MLPHKPWLALMALSLSLAVPMVMTDAAQAAESVPNKLHVTKEKSAITILQRGTSPLYEVFTKKFVELGRFNYYPIGYRSDTRLPSIDEMRDKFNAYLTANAAAIASEGKKPSLKFGDVEIAGKDLDLLLESAYVMVPVWEYGATTLGDPKVNTDVAGTETTTVVASAPLTLSNEVVNLRTGEVIGKQSASQTVTREIKLVIPSITPANARKALMAKFQADLDAANTQPAAKYFAEHSGVAAEGTMSLVMRDVRKLDAFVLRSTITENDGALKMLLGDNMGVIHDSTWNVYRKQDNEIVNVGFLKVRGVDETDSSFQAIQDTVGFEPGDQLVEHPQTGYDTGVRIGMAAFDIKGGSALAPALMLTGERNLASMFKSSALSELYATVDTNFLLPGLNIKTLGAEGLIGVKKRFYVNQFILSAGVRGGVAASSAEVAESSSATLNVMGVGFGVGPAAGIEYQANPDLKFGFDVGYQLFTPVVPFKATVKSKSGDVSTDYTLSEVSQAGFEIPENIGASGLIFSVNGTYSF